VIPLIEALVSPGFGTVWIRPVWQTDATGPIVVTGRYADEATIHWWPTWETHDVHLAWHDPDREPRIMGVTQERPWLILLANQQCSSGTATSLLYLALADVSAADVSADRSLINALWESWLSP
jgi:hypothetical protein